MVKKYTDNYRLDIAYATIFRNLNAIEEIPIHTALDITSGDNLTKKDMVSGTHIVYGGGGDTGSTHSVFNVDYKTIGIGRVGARCGCVFEIIPNSWVTDNALMIQSYDKRFALDFLRHFLSYSDLGQYANNAMQPVISKTRIKDVTIPLIDIQEQNALSKILNSIEKNEKFESNDYNLLKSKIKIIDNWETLNVEIKIQNDLIAQLKQSILQEAIQGKLTADWREQNPNTEPATELLKRIKAEKDQLVKDKKIKKEKALPPITEEEIPFELPEGWAWCRIPFLFHVLSSKGKQIKAKNYLSRGKYPIVDQGRDIIGGYSDDNDKLMYVKDPIIIFGDHTREVKIIDFDFIPGADGTQILSIFKPTNTKYLYWALKSIRIKSKGYSRHFKILKSKCIPIPPVREQKAIADTIETLLQKCQSLEQEIQTSEANAQMLMQAVLKEAFEGKKEFVEV